jgi:hypothetical protein
MVVLPHKNPNLTMTEVSHLPEDFNLFSTTRLQKNGWELNGTELISSSLPKGGPHS